MANRRASITCCIAFVVITLPLHLPIDVLPMVSRSGARGGTFCTGDFFGGVQSIPMAAIYRESDVDPMALVDRRIAVLGYGSLGRPIALNLRDGGLKVAVGSLADDYAAQAQADGFEVTTLSEAARRSDVVWLLVPDEAIAEVYVQ